jgi:general nucleoside transport system permease protein
MMLDIFLTASLWAAAIRIATPLIFGTLGELICERAGVLNLGIEGIMTAGAFAGWLTVFMGGDLWLGVAVAGLVGSMLGLLHGFLVVPLALSQHVTGIGITLLATSLSYYIYRLVFPAVSSPPKIEAFMPIFPGAPEILQQSPLTYLAFALVAVVTWFIYRTPMGLALRTVGENPAAAEAQGIDVVFVRIFAVAIGSALMGIGGSFLTLSAFNSFFFEMINGRGWICIALVVFGSWRPFKALLGALLFGLFDAFQLRLQQVAGARVPYQLFLMLPYVLSIVALIVMSRRVAYPRALMVPYRKGER